MARKRRGGSNIWMSLALAAGVQLGMVGGLYALSQTDAGQEFLRIHKIKFLEPDKPKEDEPKPPEPEPVTPPPQEAKIEKPQVMEAPAPAATSAPSVAIGGSGGPNWSGGKFIGGLEDGPMGAFHAGVLGRIRSCFGSWPGPAQPAEVALSVTAQGSVTSYKLVHGTGVSSDDAQLLEAIHCVQQKGVSAPPEGVGRVVTLRLRPSRGGFVSGQG